MPSECFAEIESEVQRRRPPKLLGLVVATSQATPPVERDRYDEIGLDILLPQSLSEGSGEGAGELRKPGEFQCVDHPIDGRLVAPEGEKLIDRRVLGATGKANGTGRDVCGREGT